MSQLEALLQQCTVKLTLPSGSQGTGFFVAPGLILTCAHVVRKAPNNPNNQIEIFWPCQDQFLSATLQKMFDDGKTLDIALLALAEPYPNHCCVLLDEASVAIGQQLYSYGYLTSYPNAAPVRCISEGLTGDIPPLLKFQAGQIEGGLSGAALIDLSTGKVCGMVKETRASTFDLGGGAIPTRVILAKLPELVEQQRSFHQCDQRWNTLVAKLSSDEAMRQTNLSGTNYQTQGGANSTNFIGGEHHHHRDASQVKPTVNKILMLSANPENPGTSRRREEIREITSALDRATLARLKQGKHDVIFDSPLDQPAIRAANLSQELSTIEPYIINISGHENGIEGLTLEGNCGITTFKNPENLIANLFQFHARSVQCIILNGCYSDVQAREIVQHIDFVIGISRDLKDDRVIKFLSEFYYQLGLERTIKAAYDISCNVLQRTDIEDINLLPTLLDKYNEIKRRELEKKLGVCDKDVEKNQDDVELWKKRASLLKELGRAEEANEAYEKASSLAPNDYKIRTEQGDTLEQLEKYKEAVNAYDKALELETEDYIVWWKKGQALVEEKKYDEAVQPYEQAVKLKPPSPDRYIICREYASLLEKLGEYRRCCSSKIHREML